MTKCPANTARDTRNHWTVISTFLGLISSVYCDFPVLDFLLLVIQVMIMLFVGAQLNGFKYCY